MVVRLLLCSEYLELVGSWRRWVGTADELPGWILPPAHRGCKTGSLLVWGRLAATVRLSSTSQGWG